MLKDTQEVLTEDEKKLRELHTQLLQQRREKLDAKQVEYAERQRQKRAGERAAGVVRPRPKPLRVEVVELDDDPDLPPRRSWSHTSARKVKKKQPVEAAAEPTIKAFHGGSYVTQIGGERPAEWPISTDELSLDNLDVTPPPFKGYESLIRARVKCRETAAFLLVRANRQANIANTLFKAATKISNCSLWGLFQSVNPTVNYKIGTALCKCRLCPNCQRVLSAKRKANFVDWFLLNVKQLRPYFFYHMVLTVRHSSADGVRTGFYVPDMLLYFAQLRGTCTSLSGAQRRERSRIWKEFVAGGTYSLEVKPSEDGSPNVHIHCLLVGRKQLVNEVQDSAFLLHVKPLWKDITGDSENIFVDKVYYMQRARDKKTGHLVKDSRGKQVMERVDAFRGSDVNIEAAVAEGMKYTIKADCESLDGLSDAFLTDLLSLKKRYYARFGCLSANDKDSKKFVKLDMLKADFQDLERLTEKEMARLFDPETGEIIQKEATSILVTPFKNMKPQDAVKGPTVERAMLPPSQWQPRHARVYEPLPLERLGEATGAVYSDWWPGREPGPGPGGITLGWSEHPFSYGGEPYYSLKPNVFGETVWFPHDQRDRAAVLLSRSISADYGQPFDLPEVFDAEAEKGI